jgi:uncharacterized protein
MKNIQRTDDVKAIMALQKTFPVTGILGPRQSGKTFLAERIKHNHYFDLENPRDLARLNAPQTALENLEGVIVIDEIQRKPELFSLLRYLVDKNRKQKYLILGSAAPQFLRQSSETLAGRIGYFNLAGFSLSDVGANKMNSLWIRGGFPRAFLAGSEQESFLWLTNYITTFLERDIPQLGITIPSASMRRFWMMLAHYHGQVLNYSELGRAFGLSDMAIRRYIDILSGTFMARILQPWHVNIGKRLVKRPKVYIRDSGILHTLLSIQSMEQLQSNPKIGASWEGFAMENLVRSIGKKDEELFFWSTHSGAEVDLLWQNAGKNWAAEFKFSDAPVLTKSMQSALEDLKLEHLWVVYPGKQNYKLSGRVSVITINEVTGGWKYTGI